MHARMHDRFNCVTIKYAHVCRECESSARGRGPPWVVWARWWRCGRRQCFSCGATVDVGRGRGDTQPTASAAYKQHSKAKSYRSSCVREATALSAVAVAVTGGGRGGGWGVFCATCVCAICFINYKPSSSSSIGSRISSSGSSETSDNSRTPRPCRADRNLWCALRQCVCFFVRYYVQISLAAAARCTLWLVWPESVCVAVVVVVVLDQNTHSALIKVILEHI